MRTEPRNIAEEGCGKVIPYILIWLYMEIIFLQYLSCCMDNYDILKRHGSGYQMKIFNWHTARIYLILLYNILIKAWKYPSNWVGFTSNRKQKLDTDCGMEWIAPRMLCIHTWNALRSETAVWSFKLRKNMVKVTYKSYKPLVYLPDIDLC